MGHQWPMSVHCNKCRKSAKKVVFLIFILFGDFHRFPKIKFSNLFFLWYSERHARGLLLSWAPHFVVTHTCTSNLLRPLPYEPQKFEKHIFNVGTWRRKNLTDLVSEPITWNSRRAPKTRISRIGLGLCKWNELWAWILWIWVIFDYLTKRAET